MMTLRFQQRAPEDVLAAAHRTLAQLADVPDGRGGTSPLALHFVSPTPLEVHSLGLEGLVNGGGLTDTQVVAWRAYVLDKENDPVGVVDVAPSGGGTPAHLLNYTRGPQVASSDRAFQVAESDPRAEGEYQPRFLEIPGVNTSALWLRSLNDKEDIIVPLDPVPRFLRAASIYSPKDFLEKVRRQAVKRIKLDDAPAGIGGEGIFAVGTTGS